MLNFPDRHTFGGIVSVGSQEMDDLADHTNWACFRRHQLFFDRVMATSNPVLCRIAILPLLICLAGCSDRQGRFEHFKDGGTYMGSSPDISHEGLIIYSSPESGHGDLFITDLKTMKQRRVGSTNSYEGDPRWSSDGQNIVFVREQNGIGHLWQMAADGSGQQQLTFGDFYDSQPAFIHDSRRVLFVRKPIDAPSALFELYVREIDGTLKRLTSNDFADGQPDPHPGGDRTLLSAFQIAGKVQVVRISDGAVLKMISSGGAASYSRDGQRIALMDDATGSFQYELFLTDADGGNKVQITRKSAYRSPPRWVSDHEIIFLESGESVGLGEIIVQDIDSGKSRTVGTVPSKKD